MVYDKTTLYTLPHQFDVQKVICELNNIKSLKNNEIYHGKLLFFILMCYVLHKSEHFQPLCKIIESFRR